MKFFEFLWIKIKKLIRPFHIGLFRFLVSIENFVVEDFDSWKRFAKHRLLVYPFILFMWYLFLSHNDYVFYKVAYIIANDPTWEIDYFYFPVYSQDWQYQRSQAMLHLFSLFAAYNVYFWVSLFLMKIYRFVQENKLLIFAILCTYSLINYEWYWTLYVCYIFEQYCWTWGLWYWFIYWSYIFLQWGIDMEEELDMERQRHYTEDEVHEQHKQEFLAQAKTDQEKLEEQIQDMIDEELLRPPIIQRKDVKRVGDSIKFVIGGDTSSFLGEDLGDTAVRYQAHQRKYGNIKYEEMEWARELMDLTDASYNMNFVDKDGRVNIEKSKEELRIEELEVEIRELKLFLKEKENMDTYDLYSYIYQDWREEGIEVGEEYSFNYFFIPPNYEEEDFTLDEWLEEFEDETFWIRKLWWYYGHGLFRKPKVVGPYSVFFPKYNAVTRLRKSAERVQKGWIKFILGKIISIFSIKRMLKKKKFLDFQDRSLADLKKLRKRGSVNYRFFRYKKDNK